MATLLVLPAVLLCASCGDEPGGSGGTIICSSHDEATFLRSKLDDDDGDGLLFDEDYPDIDDEDDDISDHTWIRDDAGIYHLFFQNEDHGGGTHIEHYTSADLQDLDYAGVALEPSVGGWDSYSLWAPYVIEHDGTYFMFYTGVEGVGPDAVQRIGLATSSDLTVWTRYPVNNCPGTSGDGCLYECDEPWTTWGGPGGSYNQQCRDPFVIWDEVAGHWVMFATARSTNQYGVVTVAYSEDLLDWAGAGFINVTRRLPAGPGGLTTGGQAENPFVVSHAGIHFLFFTDWEDPEDTLTVAAPRTIVQYATSTRLTADSTGSSEWTYRGYIPDPGVNAVEIFRAEYTWIMSQSVSNERSGDYEHRRELRLKCIHWGLGATFETLNAHIESDPAPAQP